MKNSSFLGTLENFSWGKALWEYLKQVEVWLSYKVEEGPLRKGSWRGTSLMPSLGLRARPQADWFGDGHVWKAIGFKYPCSKLDCSNGRYLLPIWNQLLLPLCWKSYNLVPVTTPVPPGTGEHTLPRSRGESRLLVSQSTRGSPSSGSSLLFSELTPVRLEVWEERCLSLEGCEQGSMQTSNCRC